MSVTVLNRLCFRCGNPVQIENNIKEYPFFCPNCFENMFNMETILIESPTSRADLTKVKNQVICYSV